MRNQLKTVVAAIVLVSGSFVAHAFDKTIPESQLPTEVKAYIKRHFPSNGVLKASVDEDHNTKSYEVTLQNRIKLEFNTKNKIKEIKAHSELPKSVIPERILAYVEANYPNNIITEWELEHDNQQVELENGLELEFTMKGDFVKIDD